MNQQDSELRLGESCIFLGPLLSASPLGLLLGTPR